MRVLGVDPGFDRCGLAVIEADAGRETVLASGCLTTKSKDAFETRLLELGENFDQWLKQWQPEVVAIEKLFFATNQKTAMRVAEVRGLLIYLVARRGALIREFTPLQIKQTITGYGAASKNQVADMVKRLVTLAKPPRFDDEYDALAIALVGLAHERFAKRAKS